MIKKYNTTKLLTQNVMKILKDFFSATTVQLTYQRDHSEQRNEEIESRSDVLYCQDYGTLYACLSNESATGSGKRKLDLSINIVNAR